MNSSVKRAENSVHVKHQGMPTVALEVGYTETYEKLIQNAPQQWRSLRHRLRADTGIMYTRNQHWLQEGSQGISQQRQFHQRPSEEPRKWRRDANNRFAVRRSFDKYKILPVIKSTAYLLIMCKKKNRLSSTSLSSLNIEKKCYSL